MERGNYSEIAGGSITETVDDDYNIYAGRHIINTAGNSVLESGANKGVKFGAPLTPPEANLPVCDECAKEFTLAQIKAAYNDDKEWNKKPDRETHINSVLPFLNKYRDTFKLNTCIRKAEFIAQILVESEGFLAGVESGNRSSKSLNASRFHADAKLADYFIKPVTDPKGCWGRFTSDQLNSVIQVEYKVDPKLPKEKLPVQKPLVQLLAEDAYKDVKIDQRELYGRFDGVPDKILKHGKTDRVLFEDDTLTIKLKIHKCFEMEFFSREYAIRVGKNGDEFSRDGYKFRGHGLIQLTGKSLYIDFSNYRKAHPFPDDSTGYIDFTHEDVHDPIPKGDFDKIADYSNAMYNVQSALWYINNRSKNLTTAMDKDDIKLVTYYVNGGYNGLTERNKFVKNARGEDSFKVFKHYEKIYNDSTALEKNDKADPVDKSKAKQFKDLIVSNLRLLNASRTETDSSTKKEVQLKDSNAKIVMTALGISDTDKATK